MSQETLTPTAGDQDADGGGTQPGARTFTKAELEDIVRDRLARQKRQYGDYDALKAASEELAVVKAAQMSELEQAQALVTSLTAERDAANQLANDRLIRASFVAEAAKANAAHPEDAFSLADLAGVTIDDSGQVSGVEAAVTALIEGNRLVLSTRPPAPELDGGAGGGNRSVGTIKLTAAEEATARKMGLTPEDYAASKTAIEAHKPTV